MKHDYPMTPKRMLLRRLTSLSAKIKRLNRMPVGELSGSQLLLLPIIASFDEPPTLGELADANESSYQNTRQILDKLEKTGYVTIITDQVDSRVIHSLLTERGEAAVEWYYQTMYDAVTNVYGGISEEDVETALRVLDFLYERIDSLQLADKTPK